MYNNTGDDYAFVGLNIPISSANIDGTGMMLNERVKYAGKIGYVQISTANSLLNGSGTLGTLIIASANGYMIKRITIKARGTTTQGMIRLFYQEAATAFLYREVDVPAITQSPRDETLIAVIDEPFYLKGNSTLKVSTQKGEFFIVSVESVEMNYP